jgi:hypothetical protein
MGAKYWSCSYKRWGVGNMMAITKSIGYFAFNLKKLGQLKGHEVWIVLEDDNPLLRRPYRLNEMERALVQGQRAKLLDASLLELLKGDYASATMMPTKKYIFGNWTKCHMSGYYCLVNKRMHSNKYDMHLLEEIFDALGQAKVFNTLDLRSSYH